MHIVDADLEGLCRIGRIAFAQKEKVNEIRRPYKKDQGADRSEDRIEHDLKLE